MIENRPFATFVSHGVLVVGILIVVFPVWITFVAATHDAVRVTQVPFPLLPGDQFFVNLKATFASSKDSIGGISVNTTAWDFAPIANGTHGQGRGPGFQLVQVAI